ncbi:hypothetical protein LJ707_10470 [Mucilaginibacter sp. UR6-1]|uniref:WapI family immunity protein n=1 Tax=Mucilaginibacter sp. UR6-1 TaxID=1435643 RepID=UPI001E3E7181|nr:hypothetical protein [Mucilaginibacter sp. UR6-1]MCC8409357.1 hypothetical protein [Mucilaginibacter sp. UR6-1]
MSIVFKKVTGEHIFSLENFTNIGMEHPVIGYEFSFFSDGFIVKLPLEAELFDLEDLFKGLSYINQSLKGGVYFQPMISGRIKIKIDMTDRGQIEIDGTVNDPSHSTKLSFKFLSDQTFLPDLISQCKMTINALERD